MFPAVQPIADIVSQVLEFAGIAVIAAGAAFAIAAFLLGVVRRRKSFAYHDFRRQLGRAVLLGLEFLVAADIIRTVAIDLTLEKLSALALLIFLRAFLSLTLEVEIEGRWPWDRGRRRELDEVETRGASGAGA